MSKLILTVVCDTGVCVCVCVFSGYWLTVTTINETNEDRSCASNVRAQRIR